MKLGVPMIGAFLVGLLVLGGCKEDKDFPGGLEVSVQEMVLTLHNRSNVRVYYMVVESETAAVIDWAPNIGANTPSIDPQKSIEINVEDIIGYDDGAEQAIVYHWIGVEENGVWVVGDFQQIVVHL